MTLASWFWAATAGLLVICASTAASAQAISASLALPDDPSVSLGQNPSPAQTPDKAAESTKDQRQKAQEQLREQERQRVMGVMATFNTTLNRDAVPLDPEQKFQLFFKSTTDPWPFLLTSVVAGIGQADDTYPEWGQGTEGYAKRYGAAYSDYFIGNFFGNAVLPSLIHEDPRYFQKGTGSFASRFWWAAASTVWCKRDKGGWGPNYANVAGNMIGAAISDIYYPASDHTVGDTVMNGLTVSAEGTVGAEIIEFWPDIARHYKRRHAEKLARHEAQMDSQSTSDSAPQPAPVARPDNPRP